jgi:hypothetical protein
MNAQRFQQIRMDVRRTIGRHTLALSLGLSLLIIALAALGYMAQPATFAPATSRPHPAPIASQGWPGATLTGSAYNGQSAQAAHITAPAAQGWPGATHAGSAYDGQSAHPLSLAVPSSGWPGATLTGSAYNEPSQLAARPIAPSSAQGWPGTTLTGSAYNGQPIQSSRLAALVASWPGATLMGSAYNGQ